MRKALIILLFTLIARWSAASGRPNVLFIAVDDLRPQLHCYGKTFMKTPHLDKLADEGRLFHNHFVQVPTCGASRYCMLTGRRPPLYGQLSNEAIHRRISGTETEPETPESWPHLFRNNGYHTVCIGKISHYPDGRLYTKGSGTGKGKPELPWSWDRIVSAAGKWKTGWDAFFGYADGTGRVRGESPPVEAADVDDRGYPDGLIADAAIKQLEALAEEEKPFLLAVGFYKPHLPFNAPKKYWDMYDPDTIPSSPNPEKPKSVSPLSVHGSGEMFGNYRHPENARHDPAHLKRLKHGYCACVSYVDAQAGRVLDKLEKLGLGKNTIVIVWGDHGWHLGDHSMWGKHTNFERALRSAFIVRTPRMNRPGVATKALVETLDIYPTLAELCTLPAEGLSLGGKSLVPYLTDPEKEGKKAAFGYWSGGTTMRTDRWRLTVYPATRKRDLFVELFDHKTDFSETKNCASEHAKVVTALKALMEQHHSEDP